LGGAQSLSDRVIEILIMRTQKTVLVVHALLLAVLMAGLQLSCDRGRETSESRAAKIAALLPISGPNAAQGIGMMNSCKAAIRDINDSGQMGKLRLELMELDDESKPEASVKAAEKAAQDPLVLAATAHWNSGPALATVPIFHRAGLANLVPGAINSRITLEQPGDEIFRIDAHDLIIVQHAAALAATTKAWKKVFILDDSTFYGKDLAAKFKKDYTEKGGTVVGQDSVQVGDKDFAALLTKIKGQTPDAIFFGGIVTEAALLRRQMETLGFKAGFVSLTGIFTDSFLEAAGNAAEGTYSVTVVPPLESLPGRRQFTESYARGKFKHPAEAWGVYAYASVQVLAEAIKRAGTNPTRRGVIEELKKGAFDTVVGRMSFDRNGQTTLITLFVYQVENGRWVPKYKADGKGGLEPLGK